MPSEPELTEKRKKTRKEIFDPSQVRSSPGKRGGKKKKPIVEDTDESTDGDGDTSPSEMGEEDDDGIPSSAHLKLMFK